MDLQCAYNPTFWGYIYEHPDVVGILLATATAVVSWVINAKLARRLQRKQLAIETIFRLSENQHYVEAIGGVFSKIYKDKTFDWKALAARKYSNKIGKEDLELVKKLGDALNYCEGISIAVLNNAVDEKVIQWSQRSIFTGLYTNTHAFIEEVQRHTNNGRAWCNYTKLAKKWIGEDEKGKDAVPSP
jgi:hypothetical protein